MKRAAVLLFTLAGCAAGGASGPAGPPPPPADPAAEPERIILQHILISFEGARAGKKRSRADAEKLASDVLERAKKGEDFDRMMKDLSEDPGPGVYRLSNTGVEPKAGDEYPRKQMVAAFGDVGFKLKVGEVGLAPYDPKASPYGWHVIKRLK
jgi:foldase protein PrsA